MAVTPVYMVFPVWHDFITMSDVLRVFDEDDTYDRECIDSIMNAISNRDRSAAAAYDTDATVSKNVKKQKNVAAAAKANTQTVYEWAGVGETDRCEVWHACPVINCKHVTDLCMPQRLVGLMRARGPGVVVLEPELKAMTKDKMGFTAVKRDLHALIMQGRVKIVNPQRGSRGRSGWTVVDEP